MRLVGLFERSSLGLGSGLWLQEMTMKNHTDKREWKLLE